MKSLLRKYRGRLIACIVLVALAAALLQIDIVRQNLEIVWIQITGSGWHLRGTCRTLAFWSNSLGEKRQVIVYLPPGYGDSENAHKRYPVLYLLHGSPDPGDGWLRYGRAPEEVDRLITLEHYPSMIVVMPDGNGQGALGDSEYVDSPVRQRNGRPGLKIGTFITHDLVDWIDGKYRTIQSASGRLIGGISTGGYGAANLGMQNPQEFGIVMSFSGYYRADPTGWARPVWGHHPSPTLLQSQSPDIFVKQNAQSLQGVYVIVGDGASDRLYYRHDANRFYNEVRSLNIKASKFEYPGRHSWDLWRTLLRTSLRTVRDRIPADTA